LSLKIPPQTKGLGIPFETSSALHFTQLRGGDFQIIYEMTGALGRWFCTLKAFKIQKSVITLPGDNAMRFLDNNENRHWG
jgi:hypothetical protein